MSSLLRTLVFAGLLAAAPCCDVLAQRSKPLDKATAAKILTSMGYSNVVIGAVVQSVGGMGMGAFSGESVAMVFAVGLRNGGTKKIQESFFYDSDFGWFFYEFDNSGEWLRLWTASGFKEFRPKESPAMAPAMAPMKMDTAVKAAPPARTSASDSATLRMLNDKFKAPIKP